MSDQLRPFGRAEGDVGFRIERQLFAVKPERVEQVIGCFKGAKLDGAGAVAKPREGPGHRFVREPRQFARGDRRP